MEAAYIKKLCIIFAPAPYFVYDLLRPTGRWKMENGPEQTDGIYVEHKGPLFKRWIHEDSIVFGPVEKEEIFLCREVRKKEKSVFICKGLASLPVCMMTAYAIYMSGPWLAFAGIAAFCLVLIWNTENESA